MLLQVGGRWGETSPVLGFWNLKAHSGGTSPKYDQATSPNPSWIVYQLGIKYSNRWGYKSTFSFKLYLFFPLPKRVTVFNKWRSNISEWNREKPVAKIIPIMHC